MSLTPPDEIYFGIEVTQIGFNEIYLGVELAQVGLDENLLGAEVTRPRHGTADSGAIHGGAAKSPPLQQSFGSMSISGSLRRRYREVARAGYDRRDHHEKARAEHVRFAR